MSLMTHPLAIRLRAALRGTGLAKPLRLLTSGRDYEDGVDRALFNLVHTGDVVWDVGANIGHYTTQLAEKVGPNGSVIAFEPSPQNFQKLKLSCDDLANVTALQLGLSDTSRTLKFEQGDDDIGATSRLVSDVRETSSGAVDVDVKSGDDIVARALVASPNVIKIDVEGHEAQALRGLGNVLKAPGLRGLVIEIHFAILDAAGETDAPRHIERQLSDVGFKTSWIDASHLMGVRTAGPSS